MTFTKEKITAINEAYTRIRKERGFGREGVHGLEILNGISCVSIYSHRIEVCRLTELNEMIEELTDMVSAIEQETGICL